MVIAARLLAVQKWEDQQIPTMEESMVRSMELAEMAKLIKEKTFPGFVYMWTLA